MPRRPINGPLSTEATEGLAPALQDALVDLVDLSLLGKQLHWNVVGPNFRSLHLQLDELVDAARTHSDVIAERMAALGIPPVGTAQAVTAQTDLAEIEPGWITDEKVVELTTERLESAIKQLRATGDLAEEHDAVTQDLLNGALHDLEMQHWMFQAHAA